VESDSGPGTEYILDIASLEPLREARPDLMVLGYFRTQLEGALHLRISETEFVTEHFHDPSNVMMLIRPTREALQAGFMTWKGDTFIPFSVQDFPFKAEALRDAASYIPAEIPVTAIVEEASQAIIRIPVNSAPKISRSWLSPVKLKIKIRVRTPTETKQYVKRAAIGLSGLAAAGAMSGFAVMDSLLPTPRIAPPVVVAGAPLELQAELQDRGLEVRWNRESGPVAKALEGRLALIQPDGRQEIVPLNGYQLQSGHMELPSGIDAVEVRFEVVDGSGRTSRESFSAFQLGDKREVATKDSVISVAARREKIELTVEDEDTSATQDLAGAWTETGVKSALVKK